MTRIILILLVLCLFVGVIGTFGQTCTPIRLAKTGNYNDVAGPSVSIGLALGNGSTFYYEPGMVLNYTAGSQAWFYFESSTEAGYVNVNGGFGGCQQPLDYQIRHYTQVWDITNNELWWTTQEGANDYTNCGLVASCQMPTVWSSPSGGFAQAQSVAIGVVAGRTYEIRDYMSVYIQNVGQSDWYISKVTLQVH